MKEIKGNSSNSVRDEEIPVDILLTEVFVRQLNRLLVAYVSASAGTILLERLVSLISI